MLYQILPKKEFQFDPDKMNMFLKSLSAPLGKKKSFLKRMLIYFDYEYLIDCDEHDKVSFYLNVSDGVNQEAIVNAVRVLLSEQAVIYPSAKELAFYDTVNTLYVDSEVDYRYKDKNKTMQLATYTNDGIFMNIIGMLLPGTRISLSFKVSKASIVNDKGNRFFMKQATDVELECLFKVLGQNKYKRTIIKDISNKIKALTSFERSFKVDYRDTERIFKIPGNEIMNIFQLPTLYRKDEKLIERIYHSLSGQVTLQDHEYSTGIYAGTLFHPVQVNREVRINYVQMRKHGIVSGTTGSGKSSEIEEWIDHLILDKLKGKSNVPGLTFLDPLESSALGVLDRILKFKSDGYDIDPLLKKVRYVDFSNDDYIFPISLLNPNADATETIEFLKSLYGDQQTIQVDRMMSSAIKILLNDPEEEHSIFDVEKIFNSNDSSYRDVLINRLSKNLYAQDEVNFLKNTKFNQSIGEPIYNRIDPFRNTDKKKLMFGMTSKYDSIKHIRQWMDEGYIILFNLKGLSKFEIKVIVGYLSTQYYLTSLKRPDFSLLHLLLVDEAHDVQMPIFPKVGAKSRKGGLSLNLITQFLEQFNADYLEQIMGNMNTVISFKQKKGGAETLARLIPSQDVSKSDLMQLPSMVGYLSMEEAGKERSILIKAKPPFRYTDGKLVNHEDPSQVQANLNKNRILATNLMTRDFISKNDAEKIVFAKHFEGEENYELEKELLQEGDSLLSVDGNIEWED